MIQIKPSITFIFTWLLLCVLALPSILQAKAYQKSRITIQLNGVPLSKALEEVESKSGYSILVRSSDIDLMELVSASLKDTPVKEVLATLLASQDVSYRVSGKQIAIFKPSPSMQGGGEYRSDGDNQQQVAGAVRDEQGQPIAGANITVTRTLDRTLSDDAGHFVLVGIVPGDTLLVSHTGFTTQRIGYVGQQSLDIVLMQGNRHLDEVVVIGYGTQRRVDVTSSVASIKAEDFVKGPVTDAGQLLQGKVAGLTIGVPSGDPTSGSQILLRGNTTLFGANANPLVLIDGIPGDLKTVAPEDIESVDVLKDGSAAAIYGVRGSNGVIIITTKRASGTYFNNVDYSANVSTQTIAKKLDMLTAADYRQQIQEGIRGPEWDLGSTTDWLEEATRTPVTHVHNVTIRGGNNKTNYLASANYRGMQGIFQKSNNNTFSGRLDINHSMLDDKLKINVGILNQTNNYIRNANGGSFNGWIYRQTVIRNPTEPIYNADGDFYENVGNFDYDNPLALLYESDGESKNVNSRMSSHITFQPIADLKLAALFSYSRVNTSEGYAETKKHISTIRSGLNGFASVGSSLSIDRLAELTAEYSKTFDKHRLTVLGGYGYQENEWSNMYSQNQDFPTDLFSYHNIGLGEGIKDAKAVINSGKTETNLISFFGRINYNYDDKYLLLASLRHEGASQLYGSNSPWGNFWSLSAGWRINKEQFLESASFIDDLKLRVGYGVTGNPPLDGFLSQPLLGYGNYVYSNGRWIRTLGPATNANPFIRWEEKHEYNLGLDFSFWKGRLGGNIDAYRRNIVDLLYNYQVPSPPNLYNETQANVGRMQNQGVEVILNGAPIKKRDFTWNTSVNFSTNSNKLINLSNDLYQTTTNYFTTGHAGVPIQTFTHIVFIGEGIGDFYGYKVIDVDDSGKWIYEGREGQPVTYDELPHSFEDKKVIGNGLPKYYAGWNNSFSYKNFDLDITMRGAFGYQIINSQRMYMENPAIQNYNLLKSAYEPVFGKQMLDVQALEFNSYYVEDGDHWKIDNITLGYNIKNFRSPYIKSMRLYASSMNTFIVTGYSGLDPEVNRMGLNPGLDDRDKYPTVRTFTFGVNMSF